MTITYPIKKLNGSSFACIKESINNEPPNETYWALLAEKGDTGDTGATGASIESAEFVGDDMVFTKDDASEVILTDAKTDLKGDKGDAATADVHSTITGDAGTDAIVSNEGTTSAALFKFTIPRGATEVRLGKQVLMVLMG